MTNTKDLKEEQEKAKFKQDQLKTLEELQKNKAEQEQLKKRQYALEKELGIF